VIAKDPSFAPAYAGLAAAHAVRSGVFRFDIADELSKNASGGGEGDPVRPSLTEAYDAQGMVYSRDGQWVQSEKSFRRAIELDPNRVMSYGHFAMYLLLPLGRFEEAIHQLRLAEKADPLSYEVHFDAAYVLIRPTGTMRPPAIARSCHLSARIRLCVWSRSGWGRGESARRSGCSKQPWSWRPGRFAS
jgi:tetratricopeptide (TPR) repeat protein